MNSRNSNVKTESANLCMNSPSGKGAGEKKVFLC